MPTCCTHRSTPSDRPWMLRDLGTNQSGSSSKNLCGRRKATSVVRREIRGKENSSNSSMNFVAAMGRESKLGLGVQKVRTGASVWRVAKPHADEKAIELAGLDFCCGAGGVDCREVYEEGN
ncbi:hypothetical protein Nepgr_006525 [Nepenthes gracilis]|uniref:Uncharacterized protein n=1 Tax=Nepenthes gracilis TaxID=150966 RepID=A0AAD3S5M6_NEPGR|nr:hypothetical protein Nepgr_006525 [Nepenthes gracilis]